mgnify:CR=1 FL=1
MLKKLNEFKELKKDTSIVSIYYLGQEGVIINLNGLTFCIDPYLSDYVDKNCCSDVIKWNRLYDPTIKGYDLDFVDFFLFTHTHFDHLDPWTVKDILTRNKTAKFLISKTNISFLEKYGVDKSRITSLSVNKCISFNDVVISSYPAKHDVFHEHNGEFDDLCFSIECNGFKLFHGGDTLDYPELVEHMKNSDICFLPVNGRDDFRTKNDVIGNLNPFEAFDLAYKSHSKLLIPIHNDLYSINSASLDEINNAISKFNKVNYNMLVHDDFIKVDLNKWKK